VPSSLADATWTCEATAPASCPQEQGSGDIDLTLDLPADGSLLFVIDAEITPAAGGEVLIEAEIQPGQEHDPDLSNNQVQRILLNDGIFRDRFQ